jgi:hypothetical protein
VLAVVGMGDPLSTHEPNGYGSGHKIKSMTGPRFFSRHILCLWACVWIEKKPSGFVPVAISSGGIWGTH